ncbi:glycosyltransferase [Fischerella sp. JS2]|uniref:glycosyltransferase n=1 Tax=Fischerella sp. JS2 TaxID=2597771 RepID=UPI0028F09C7E|nr:glycosyltransferase [Fischerella sp. JS2]
MRFLIDGQTLSTPEIHRGIGVVFKQICEQLVLHDISKEWLITVRDRSDLKHFSHAVQKRLIPIIVNESLNQDDYINQTKHYSQLLNQVVTELKIDAYWVPNPLMVNVVLPTDLSNVTIFATIYDLIPLLMPDYYIAKWPDHIKAEYKRRIEILPTWADKLIFISESAKKDYEKIDPRVANKSLAIPLAVDHTKFWSYISPRDKSQEPYILFTGGFDPRKNMYAALEAFSYLVKDNYQEFNNLKFYVVCAYNEQEKRDYEHFAAKLGVLDKLVLTGYVKDEELITLYRQASIFFFPSRYEGFGLPVLEALACGLPVVTTNVSSIPEVAGDLAYYCSPDDPKDMAIALKKALCDRANNQSRQQDYIQHAKEFTWSKTTANYFRLFTNTLFDVNTSEKLNYYKIAYVSPWPPQRSGIANYSYEIVRYLKEYADITLYVDNEQECRTDTLELPLKNISALPKDVDKYDCIVYHIGNNTKFHQEIYRMAWQYPGIVVLHELNIHPFLADAFLNTKDEYLYADALREGYGEQGASSYDDVKFKRINPNIWTFPLSHALVKRSIATIVHSQWVKEQLQEIKNIFVIPHGSVYKTVFNIEDDVIALKKRFGISEKNFLISTFGFVNVLKRIPTILEAIKILIDLGYPIQLFIGGELLEPSLRIEEKIETLGISNNVIISGYLSDEDFDHCIKMSDIILNLRYPSLGESSGVLMKAFSYGKACIVSDYQQFSELPDSICWKVDVGDLEVPLLVAYLEELMRNPAARKQLGKNAAFFSANYSSYEIAGKLYSLAISRVMQVKKLILL